MIIEYVGHSCFDIVNKEGVHILTDPYDDSIGLAPVSRKADILLVSHHHYDHDHVAGVGGGYRLFDTPGAHEAKGVKITGFELPHDEEGGAKRGMVVAFLIETDGIRILHMGDVGVMPDGRFFQSAGRVDILMIPIGGTYTVDADGALAIMDKLDPNITIPMHYKTSNLNMDIETAHKFTTLIKKHYDLARLGGSKFEITADNLKKRGRVLLMENSF
jgi:L-ascorbate metabolism protein UlaG (beta-lactamase superfamily)